MADDPFYISPESEDRILAAAERRRAQFRQMQSQVTPFMAQRAQEVVQRWPNASPGVVQTAAQLNLPDQAVDQIAEQDDGGWSLGSMLGSTVGFLSDGVEKAYEYAVKPVVRGAFTLADGIAEEVVQRPFTAASAVAFGDSPSLRQAYNEYGDSPLVNVLTGDTQEFQTDEQGNILLDENGQRVPIEGGSLGTGLFPGGGAAAESDAERTLTINGRPANFGRAVPLARGVGAMVGYDSTAYDVVSGVTQFAADVLLDPLALVTGGSSTVARGLARAGASARTVRAVEGGVSGARAASRQLDASQARSLLDEVAPSPARGAGLVSAEDLSDLDDLSGAAFRVSRRSRSADAPASQRRAGTFYAIGEDADYAGDLVQGVARPGNPLIVSPGRRSWGDSLPTSSGEEAARELLSEGDFRYLTETNSFSDRVSFLENKYGVDLSAMSESGDVTQKLLEVAGSREAMARGFDSIVMPDEFGPEFVALSDDVVKSEADEAADYLRDVKSAVGMVEGGGRQSVLIEKVEDFFGHRGLLSELAGASRYDIYQSFRRSPVNHIDTATIRRLGDATDELSVSDVLLDSVQRAQVTEKGFYSGLRGVRRTVRNTRLSGLSPRGKVSLEDMDDATGKVDSFLRQAKVDRKTRERIFDQMLDINNPSTPWADRGDRFFEVVTDAMEAASGNMAGELGAIKRAAQMIGDDYKAFREYGVHAAGDPIFVPYMKTRVDPGTGAEILNPTPQLTSELLREGFELPDVTAVRRAASRVSKMERLYTTKGWKYGSDAARWATRDLFKPLAILRPAYVVRIGLEEQARLAAAGYDSMFNHPFRFIQANIKARQHDVSLTGDSFEQVADALNAVNRSAYDVRAKGQSGGFTSQVWGQMQKPAEATTEFVQAWRHELAQLAGAREARWLARNGGDLDGFVDWARNTEEGRGVIERVARINPEVNDLLTSDESVRAWGDSILQRIAAKTGGTVEDGVVRSLGDEDLLDAVASGRVHGAMLADRTSKASLSNFLRGKFDVAPQVLKYDTSLIGDTARSGQLNKAVDWLFDTLTSRPTNSLARYPAFRQSYIKNVQRSMDALSDDSLRAAYAAKLDEMFTLTTNESEQIGRALELSKGKAGFYDSLDELDEVIKVRSASEVKDLLFDVTNRSNIQDSYETGLPFFDAWAEVTRTWGRLVKENPSFFLRAGAGMESARESGVIYANDLGDEVFAYPGGGILSRFFPGDATVTLEGRLQGANLVAQGVGPGFGPVVQWGVGAFMGNDRDLQQLREWLAPFGTGGIESAGDLSNPNAFVESFVPAWMRKFSNALTGGDVDPVQFNSMMGDVMKSLASSGSYRPGDPTDQQRLLADAEKGARFLLMMRGLVQGVGITGPSATWRIKTDGDEGEQIPQDWDPEADPDGVFHTIGTLASEYRRLREHYNFDDELATSAFIDLYGVEPWYISQAKTRSLANLPVDEEGFGWVQEHADVAAEFPSTIGYFVPPNEDAELDYAIYRDQIDAGDRQSLTAEQQVQLANKTKAYSILEAVKRRIEGVPSGERERVLAHARGVLEEQFPGFSAPVLGVGDRLDTQQRIEQLSRAAFDERLADSPVAPTLQTYMRARQYLLDAARSRTGEANATLARQDTADLAERLRDVGTSLAQRDPAFSGVWSQLLSQEVTA